MNNYLIDLIIGVLLPVIPAYLLYKLLPAKTTVTGPFKGLNIKLSGAFSGYFLVLLIVFAYLTMIFNSNVKQLAKENDQLKSLYSPWIMEGAVRTENPEITKLFIDTKNVHFQSTGRFTANLLLKKNKESFDLPGAICIFNRKGVYKVLNLSINSDDLKKYDINIMKDEHKIKIGNVIDLEAGW